MVHVGLSLMFEDTFRVAALPLFEAGLVDAIEYSFELGWACDPRPAWVDPLLDHYAAVGRLWGHGVTMSPFSVRRPGQRAWLDRVRSECEQRPFVGVSEHFGFMTADDLDGGAPLPVPPGPGARDIGIASLRRLADATGAAVGLENLALALSEADVWRQGSTLGEVLDSVDGYLVLDLHNLDCQLRNYGAPADEVLATYPLARVRCIHLSGGSDSGPADGLSRTFRRDTHDGDVPASVFDLLHEVLPRCPGLETVIVERLGATLADEASHEAFAADLRRTHAIVEARTDG